MTLSVGILAADLLRSADEIERLGEAGVNCLHVDVMDGVFCPQMTVGPAFVAALPDRFAVDVHLMVDEPLGKVDAYVDAGARHRDLPRRGDSPSAPRAPEPRGSRRDARRGAQPGHARSRRLSRCSTTSNSCSFSRSTRAGRASGSSPGPGTALAAARELVAGREVVLGVDGGVTRENIGTSRRSASM